MSLRVALVGGPMYDDLYERLPDWLGDDADVVVHADHPTLNRRVAEMLDAGERLDVISTHGKYAPSQSQWLQPLDDLLDDETLAPLAPKAVDLCRFRGDLLCVPRNIDVRVLWWRTDVLDAAPASWDDVEQASRSDQNRSFGFTGRESGLFGLFYELMVSAGGAPFDADGRATDADRRRRRRVGRTTPAPRRPGPRRPPALALRRGRRCAPRRSGGHGRRLARRLRAHPHLRPLRVAATRHVPGRQVVQRLPRLGDPEDLW